jgi:hypothetical protein
MMLHYSGATFTWASLISRVIALGVHVLGDCCFSLDSQVRDKLPRHHLISNGNQEHKEVQYSTASFIPTFMLVWNH